MYSKNFQLLNNKVGHPLESTTLYGPLHNQVAVENYKNTINEALHQGGKIEFGGKVINRPGNFVEPTIISNLKHNAPVIMKETFAPIVYVLKTKNLDEAIEWNNEVDQGLSSAIFTKDITSVFQVNFFHSCTICFLFSNQNKINYFSGSDPTDRIVVW